MPIVLCRCGTPKTLSKSYLVCPHCDTPCPKVSSICPSCRTIAKES